MEKFEINKGGLVGALAGTLASLGFHKKEDNLAKRAMKTTLFGLGGFFLGNLISNRVKRHKK
jgi:hypothetical protein